MGFYYFLSIPKHRSVVYSHLHEIGHSVLVKIVCGPPAQQKEEPEKSGSSAEKRCVYAIQDGAASSPQSVISS